jgi:hypothetical protein
VHKAVMAALIVTAITCSGCAGASDVQFQRQAEELINTDDARQFAFDFEGARCEQPESAAEGTLFMCSATGEDGRIHTFESRITGERRFLVSAVTDS